MKHVTTPNNERVVSLQSNFYRLSLFSYSITDNNINFGGLYVPVCCVSSLLKDTHAFRHFAAVFPSVDHKPLRNSFVLLHIIHSMKIKRR